jgi:hypothetical protein
MTPDEKSKNQFFWIMNEILENKNFFQFHEPSNEIPTYERQHAILLSLKRAGAIELGKETEREVFEGIDHKKYPLSVEIKILQPRFDELHKEYTPTVKTVTGKIKIIFSNTEGVSRADGKGEVYEIRGNRKDILFSLAEGPAGSKAIGNETGYDTQTISREIKEINEMFRKKTGIASNIIERTGTAGYHLNSADFVIEIV